MLISLGANLPGRWGAPARTLCTAVAMLNAMPGIHVERASGLYDTEPIGGEHQPHYLNAVILAKVSVAPGMLLRKLKWLESQAGRRPGRRWGPRPLDADIVDFAGRVCGWPSRERRRGQVVLPHPEAHRRAFVLMPLLDVAPAWRHPVLGSSAGRLLMRVGFQRHGVCRVLDSSWISCNEAHS